MERSQVSLPGGPHGLRTNAYRYVSCALIDLLEDIATQPELAVVVDVDALERTALAKIDRVMLLALDALVQVNVQLVLLVKHERQRAASLHTWLRKATLLEYEDPDRALADLRNRIPLVVLLGISDDLTLFAHLDEPHRGIALGTPVDVADPNIIVVSDSNVRAVLWWIVDARFKEGLISWTTHSA